MHPASELRRYTADGFGLKVTTATRSANCPHWLEDAVLLGEVSPLLQCIDFWLGQELDWTPAECDAPALASAATVQLRTRSPRMAIADTVELVIDCQRLGELPRWPAELDELLVAEWALHTVRVGLETVVLGSGDLARAGQGSLLLMPASFEAVMPVSLRCAETSAPLGPAVLDWRSQWLELGFTPDQVPACWPRASGLPADLPCTTAWSTTDTDVAAAACRNADDGCQGLAEGANLAEIHLAQVLQVPMDAWFVGSLRPDRWRQCIDLRTWPVQVELAGTIRQGEIVRLGDGLGVLLGDAVTSPVHDTG